jgi:hypothetical protein
MSAAAKCPFPASCNNSQPSRRPIGRLPTSPKKSRATGLLNGAKPKIAPSSAAAKSVAGNSSSPATPRSVMALVAGTNSATVIQSIPSMKLTRLTNHRPPRNRQPRSIHRGRGGRICQSAGSAAMIAATTMHCIARRDVACSDRISSIAPMAASRIIPAVTTNS